MDLRPKVWVIGAIIYVAFMFPMFYYYQFLQSTDFGPVDYPATFGAFLVLFSAFFAIRDDKPVQVPPNTKNTLPKQ